MTMLDPQKAAATDRLVKFHSDKVLARARQAIAQSKIVVQVSRDTMKLANQNLLKSREESST